MKLRDRCLRLIGRKMMAFYVTAAVCGLSAWRHGITWPCAAVMAIAMLVLVAGVSGEKILGTIDRFKNRE